MTVESVISNNDIIVSVLKISVPRAASISVKCNEGNGRGFSAMSALTIAPDSGNGQVALSASRIAREGENFASIQTLLFSDTIINYQVPVATKLGTYFAISVADGDYTLDTPLEIGRLDGKPITLVVGKPIN
jgi:hypothetical protein